MNTSSSTFVDFRQLRALRAVVRAASFHGAASHLGYTQSAVSQQIKALEGHVGQRLLDRSGTRAPATPTPAGWVVLRHADAIFAKLDQMADELAQLDDELTGPVRVGFFQSVGATMLPRVVRQVARRMPGVELILTEVDADHELQARLAVGELDLAFVVLPLVEDVLVATPLIDDAVVVLVREDDPLAAPASVGIGALRGRRLATFAPSPHQRAVEERLRREDDFTITIRSSDNATLAGVVASRSAVALVTELSAFEAERDGLVATAVQGLPARSVALARHGDRELGPAAQAVFELIAVECSGSPEHNAPSVRAVAGMAAELATCSQG